MQAVAQLSARRDEHCRNDRQAGAAPPPATGEAAAVVARRRPPVKRLAQYANRMSSVRTIAPQRRAWMKRIAPTLIPTCENVSVSGLKKTR